MIWFTSSPLPCFFPAKTTYLMTSFYKSTTFNTLGQFSTHKVSYITPAAATYIKLAFLLQLEKERKAREERQKRDAEEAAERQRREEEWVRSNYLF